MLAVIAIYRRPMVRRRWQGTPTGPGAVGDGHSVACRFRRALCNGANAGREPHVPAGPEDGGLVRYRVCGRDDP